MAELAYIKIFRDFVEVAREMDEKALGRLFLAVLRYANNEDPGELNGMDQIGFIILRQQIERDRREYQEKSERMAELGRRGGRKTQEKMAALRRAFDIQQKFLAELARQTNPLNA